MWSPCVATPQLEMSQKPHVEPNPDRLEGLGLVLVICSVESYALSG